MNGLVYMAARDATNGDELWRSDGTEAGTSLVANINAGPADSSPRQLTRMPASNRLFFKADDGSVGVEPRVYDVANDMVSLLADITNGDTDVLRSTAIDDTVFFQAPTGSATDVEPWYSDGTPTGTQQLADLNGNAISTNSNSDPRDFIKLGNEVFFAADDGSAGRELWWVDATLTTVTQMPDINGGGSALVRFLTRFNDSLYFSAENATGDAELWTVSDSLSTPSRVIDINPGATGSTPTPMGAGRFTVLSSGFLFEANDGTNGNELWFSNGSSLGTAMVLDINPGAGGSNPRYMKKIGDILYFHADDGVNGAELWKTDGTAAGTSMVADICPGACSGPVTGLGP
jgi:ELWxxDGT repeat protein